MKVGLALGGGGARGMAHIGVLRALEAAQIPVDLIVGTSAGAIVGALYAAGKSVGEIQELARSLTFRKWFALDDTGMGLFSTRNMHKILDESIGQDVNIEDLQRTFACVAVDLNSRQEVVFDSGPLADAVCASSAYPGLFAPVRIHDRVFLDGGVLNPVPFDVAARMGADRVIAVDLGAEEPFAATVESGQLPSKHPLGNWFYTVSHQPMMRVIDRTLQIMLQEIRDQKLRDAPPDIMIYPRMRQVGLLDFHLTDLCCEAGDAAVCQVLPEIQKVVYPAERVPRTLAIRKWYAKIREVLARPRVGNF